MDHCTSVIMTKANNLTMSDVGEDVEKQNSHSLPMVMQLGRATLKDSLELFYKTLYSYHII